jgi:hypothetical protein
MCVCGSRSDTNVQWALIDYAPPFELSTALLITLESRTLQSPYGTSVYLRWPRKRSKLATKIPYAATWSVHPATDVEKASMPVQGNELLRKTTFISPGPRHATQSLAHQVEESVQLLFPESQSSSLWVYTNRAGERLCKAESESSNVKVILIWILRGRYSDG